MASRRFNLFAGIFGNALEWYDFTTYAFFVPLFTELFFPSSNPMISLIIAFSVFASGFLIRPVGGILFGYLGDHFGRKKALLLSIVVMTVPSLLIGFLPTYAMWGLWAPILMTMLRLIQGLAVSGELTSTTSFLVEHAKPNRRGLAGSLAMCSALTGIVLSSAITTLVTETTTREALLNWGWRLPFIFAGVLGLLGWYIRWRSDETEHYAKLENVIDGRPTFWQHLKKLSFTPVMKAVLLVAVMAVGNYYLIAFFNAYLTKTLGWPLEKIMLINFICLMLNTLLLPVMGILSDKIGRKPVLYIGIIGLVISIYPTFLLLNQNLLFYVFLGQFIFILFLTPVAAVIPTILAELFPTSTRNMGLSVSYNLSLAIFGGTAPLVAIALIEQTQSNYAPAFYVIIAGLIALAVLRTWRESYKLVLK